MKDFDIIFEKHLFIWLRGVLVVGTLSCSMWDEVPCPGMEPGPPALGAWSHSPWSTREVPIRDFWNSKCCYVPSQWDRRLLFRRFISALEVIYKDVHLSV